MGQSQNHWIYMKLPYFGESQIHLAQPWLEDPRRGTAGEATGEAKRQSEEMMDPVDPVLGGKQMT